MKIGFEIIHQKHLQVCCKNSCLLMPKIMFNLKVPLILGVIFCNELKMLIITRKRVTISDILADTKSAGIRKLA